MEPLAAAVMMCTPMTSGPIPEPVAVVDAFVEAYNRHDMETLRSLMTADAEIRGPGDEASSTGAETMARYEAVLFKRYPGVRLKVDDRLSEGDMVAQVETWSGVGEDGSGLGAYRIDRGCIVSMSYSK